MVLYSIVIVKPNDGENINLEFELKAPLKSHTIMNEFLSLTPLEGRVFLTYGLKPRFPY